MNLYDEEVEAAFLGILLSAPEKIDEFPSFSPAWFHSEVHARIYTVILDAWNKGNPVGAPFIAQYFAHDRGLINAGGSDYIYSLSDNVISVTSVKDYAAHIQNLHARRALVALADRIKVAAVEADPDKPPEMIFAGVETFLNESRSLKKQDEPVALADSAVAALASARAPETGLSTGLPSLDRFIGGLRPENLYIVAARPGMGKTAMGMTVALNAAMAGKRGIFFSMEMSHTQLTQRALSRYSGQEVHSRNVYDWGAVEAVAGSMNYPLFIDDASSLTVSDIRARTKRMLRKGGVDLVIVDYLGLIVPEDGKANKVHQIEAITQGLKRMAKDLKVPVLLLSQLSRAVEARENKRPMLSDLRDSGAIEQDADVIMFLYREEYYVERELGAGGQKGHGFGNRAKEKEASVAADLDAVRGVAEVIVAKNRQGGIGAVGAKFDAGRQMFMEGGR